MSMSTVAASLWPSTKMICINNELAVRKIADTASNYSAHLITLHVHAPHLQVDKYLVGLISDLS